MEKENILSGGIDTLLTMKESLLELEEYRQQSLSFAGKEDQLEKQIAVKEKEIAEEVSTTTKKRRAEVESSYDEQTDKLKTRIKKAKAKKDKEKSLQVSERIKMETSELTSEKIRLKEEMKSVYEKNRIPRIFNNSLYHALFMPRCLKDIGIILITLVIILCIIPVGVYVLFLPDGGLYLAIDYIITVILFGGLYLLINSKTKEGHGNAAIDIRAIRSKLAKNQKRINAMAKDIRKDKDESTYSLEDINQELKNLDEELKQIAEGKKEAMVEFETKTKALIENEIKEQNIAELNRLKSEHEQAYSNQKKAEEKVRLFSIEIANKYETLIGKDMMSVAKIDQLIEILQSEKATTIGQALALYKERGNEGNNTNN